MAGKTDEQIKQYRTSKIMNIVAMRASFYRANPHRFVKDFLGIELKTFQKILLFAFNYYYFSFYIASRGHLALLFRNR